MTAVVTGAAGFIGSHLVEALRTEGHTVVAIDRRPLPAAPGIVPLTAELTESVPAVRDALTAADVVYHLAGCPGVRDRSPDVEHCRHRDNVLATRHVLAATPAATPIVVASSSSVYGGSHGGPCREDDPLRPRGGYAKSKVEAERLCAERRASGGAVTVTRLFTVAGERQRPDMAFARWIDAALAGRPAVVFGDPLRTRDVTDVRDVVAAMVALARSRHQGTVNVGTGSAHTLRDMLDAIGAAIGHRLDVEVKPVWAEDPDSTLADTTLLTSLTGLRPHSDLEALISRQVADTLSRVRSVGTGSAAAGTTNLPVG